MRAFMGLKQLNETQLYEAEKYKSASNEVKRKKEIYIYCNTNEGYFPVITDQYQT